MKKKRITAAFLLAAILVAFIMPGTDASAGLFDESWFDDPDGLYIKDEGLGSISAGNYTVRVNGRIDNSGLLYRSPDEKAVFDHYIRLAKAEYLIYHQKWLNEDFCLRDDVPFLYPNGTSQVQDRDGDIDDGMVEKGGVLGDFAIGEIVYPLYCAVHRISDEIDAYNNAGGSDKPLKFKELWEHVQQAYGNEGSVFGSAGPCRKSIKQYFSQVIWNLEDDAMQTWLKERKELFENNMDDFIEQEEELFGWDSENDWEDFVYFRTYYEGIFSHFVLEEETAMDQTTGKNKTVLLNDYGNTETAEKEKWIAIVYSLTAYIDDVYNKCDQMYQANRGLLSSVVLPSEVGLIEENLSELLVSVGESASSLLSSNQLVIEHIIYGRVKAENHQTGSSVNNFSFELATGNIYGVTGAFVYSLLRGILFMGILLFLMYYLAKDSLTASTRTRSKLKENIGYVFLGIALMFAMPNLIDLAIKIRDVVLQLIGNGIVQSGAAGINGLEADFKANAISTSRLVDAAQYIGIVFVTLYLGVVYIGMACTFTIMFAGFPIFLIVSFRDHKVLNEWVNFCLGVIITPIIDAVLFLIPIIASDVGGTSMPAFIKLLLCISVIPSRAVIKKMLGFSSSVGSEMLGVGAMIAAGRAMGTVARTARNTAGRVADGVKGTIDDTRNARMYQKLDDIETDNKEKATASSERAGEGLERAQKAFGDQEEMRSELGKLEKAGGIDPETGDTGKDAEAFAGESGGYGGGRSIYSAGNADPRVAEVLSSSARMGNFEDIRGLDSATKAKMYRKRALYRGAKTMLGTAGGVQGGIAGAAIGMGATSFMGTNAMIMGASSGFGTGSSVGTHAGEAVVAAGYAAGTGISKGYGVAADAKSPNGIASDYYREEPLTNPRFADMFGDGISGGELMQYAAMSGEDAESLGYCDYIRSRFVAAGSQDELFDLADEVGEFGARMQYSGTDEDRLERAAESSKIPKNASAICNTMYEEMRKAAEAKNPDGTFVNPDFNAAWNGVTYSGKNGGKKGSDGYFGTGFAAYRPKSYEFSPNEGSDTGAPTVEPTGFKPGRGAGDSRSERDSVNGFMKKHPGMSYEEAREALRKLPGQP